MTFPECDGQLVFNVATPPGRGAVGTIVVHGSRALQTVDMLFRPVGSTALRDMPLNRVVYGHWIADDLPGEDLVVCPKASTHVEIHCHGGNCAESLVGDTLVAAGAVAVDALEILNRLTGSRYQAELLLACSQAPTPRAARYLLAQLRNHFEFWSQLQQHLNGKTWQTATQTIDRVRAWSQFGRHLTEPWSVVFCGPPNVGKSSLINCLLGFQRAIVHHQAGTTRDTVSETTAVDGWPVRLSDTAGVRETSDPLERLGIDGTRKSIAHADLLILVVDANQTDTPLLQSLRNQLRPDLVVANKADLGRPAQKVGDLLLSAWTGKGVDQLVATIARRLVPTLPSIDQILPVTASQETLLGSIRQWIAEGDQQQANSATAAVCRSLPAFNDPSIPPGPTRRWFGEDL